MSICLVSICLHSCEHMSAHRKHRGGWAVMANLRIPPSRRFLSQLIITHLQETKHVFRAFFFLVMTILLDSCLIKVGIQKWIM